jgi:hypothetical protein
MDRSHVYRVSTSLMIRATVGSPAVGILKAAGRYTYKQRTPAHLEYISTFRTSKNTKPNFFPLDDFHVKIIMDDANDFPDFILFLKEANTKLGSTWFTTRIEIQEPTRAVLTRTVSQRQVVTLLSSRVCRSSSTLTLLSNKLLSWE